MGRRDNWKKMQEEMSGAHSKRTEELDHIPDIACGLCTNFKETSYGSDGRGSCSALKTGSDLSANPSVICEEGENGLITFFNTDALDCPRYVKMELVDTDGHECSDPSFQRAQRQINSRAISENHKEESKNV